MEKHLNAIGEVDEKELMELAGATEVSPQSSTWTCVTGTIAITLYTIDRSFESCPTTACSSRC